MINEYTDISDFISKTEIKRGEIISEIIVDYYQGDKEKPIRLIGFYSDVDKSDYEIYEEGYNYYNNLLTEVNKNK